MRVVGVLGVQGAIEEHVEMLRQCRKQFGPMKVVIVKKSEDLQKKTHIGIEDANDYLSNPTQGFSTKPLTSNEANIIDDTNIQVTGPPRPVLCNFSRTVTLVEAISDSDTATRKTVSVSDIEERMIANRLRKNPRFAKLLAELAGHDDDDPTIGETTSDGKESNDPKKRKIETDTSQKKPSNQTTSDSSDGLIDGLIIPGGESTAMKIIIQSMRKPLLAYVNEKPVWGTCAGAILLSNNIEGHSSKDLTECKYGPPLGGLNITTRRNYFGRQNESFVCKLENPAENEDFVFEDIEGVFIRAPAIISVDDTNGASNTKVEKLAVVRMPNGNDSETEVTVACKQGKKFITCFHPELSDSTKVHEYFLGSVIGYPRLKA